MYELMQAAGNSYWIQSPAAIGLVRVSEDAVVLIDSGSDKDAGRRVRQMLDANKWKLSAIFNTHSHADHIGGNQYLARQTGCAVYAPGIEQDLTCHPVLEPSLLFGGFPPKKLRHKLLMAQESSALPLTDQVLPQGFSILPLPGHSFDMVGFRTADDVVYLADCLASRETLAKYRITFLYDIGAALSTLEDVKKMQAALFVPAHAPACGDIGELAQYNIDIIHEIAQNILKFCKEPLQFEELLAQLFAHYQLKMTLDQYVLVGSTVRSYLAWLTDRGLMEIVIEGNRILWHGTAPSL